MAERLHMSQMREYWRTLSVLQANIGCLAVPSLSHQCVAHGGYRHEVQSHAIVRVVLGRLPRDDADIRAVCSPVSAPTGLVPL